MGWYVFASLCVWIIYTYQRQPPPISREKDPTRQVCVCVLFECAYKIGRWMLASSVLGDEWIVRTQTGVDIQLLAGWVLERKPRGGEEDRGRRFAVVALANALTHPCEINASFLPQTLPHSPPLSTPMTQPLSLYVSLLYTPRAKTKVTARIQTVRRGEERERESR